METPISILAGLPPRSELLGSENVVVGRAAEVDLVLSHPEVSRRHCRILFEGETWFVEDLGSQRGTAVNGNRISGRTALKRIPHRRRIPLPATGRSDPSRVRSIGDLMKRRCSQRMN